MSHAAWWLWGAATGLALGVSLMIFAKILDRILKSK